MKLDTEKGLGLARHDFNVTMVRKADQGEIIRERDALTMVFHKGAFGRDSLDQHVVFYECDGVGPSSFRPPIGFDTMADTNGLVSEAYPQSGYC